MDMRYFNVLNI